MAAPACARPPEPRPRRRGIVILTVLSLLAGGGLLAPARAQEIGFPPLPPKKAVPVAPKGDAQMLVLKVLLSGQARKPACPGW